MGGSIMAKKIILSLTVMLLALMAICACKTEKSISDYSHHAIERMANQNMSDSERVYLEKGRQDLKEMKILSKSHPLR